MSQIFIYQIGKFQTKYINAWKFGSHIGLIEETEKSSVHDK